MFKSIEQNKLPFIYLYEFEKNRYERKSKVKRLKNKYNSMLVVSLWYQYKLDRIPVFSNFV